MRDAVTIVAAGSWFDIQSGVHQAAIPGNTAHTHANMHSLWPAAHEEGEKPLSSLPQQHLIGRLQREAELKGEREMDGGVLRERGGVFFAREGHEGLSRG